MSFGTPSQTVLSLFVGLLLLIAGPVSAQESFVVNSDGDASNQGGTQCDTGNTIDPGDGTQLVECTLRAAIQAASHTSEDAEITFWSGFSDEEVLTLTPSNPYQTLPEGLTIDGSSHPAYDAASGRPGVFVDGSNTVDVGFRLSESSEDVTLLRMALGNVDRGVVVQNLNHRIEGLWIGLAPDGSPAPIESEGLFIEASSGSSGGQVVGNRIVNAGEHGVVIEEQQNHGILFDRNKIGVGLSSDDEPVPMGNGGYGIYVASAEEENIIGRCVLGISCDGNIIAANELGGLRIANSEGQRISANHIGMHPDAPEDATFGNDGPGILMLNDDNTVGGAVIFGNNPGNVIAHNAADGIQVGDDETAPSDNRIEANRIGIYGSTPLSQPGMGIRLADGGGTTIHNNTIRFVEDVGIGVFDVSGGSVTITGNVIADNGSQGVNMIPGVTLGGADAEMANIIGANGSDGVRIRARSGAIARVEGNFIGTDTGGANLGNGGHGINIRNAASNTVVIGRVIGGSDDALANVIGFNAEDGVHIESSDRQNIRGNYIGTNANGDNLGNEGHGIHISAAFSTTTSSRNRVGYTAGASLPDAPGPAAGGLGNAIAFNGQNAVHIRPLAGDPDMERNVVRGNEIFANAGGIFLGDDADEVDVGGGAEGPNTLMNIPEFDPAEISYDESNGTLDLRYRVRTNASNANYPLTIDLYLNDEGERQGRTYLGSDTYASEDATSFVLSTVEIAEGVTVPEGASFVATTTDAAGNTSQFSEPVPFNQQPVLAVSKDEIDFGSVAIGETEEVSFTVANEGSADLTGDVALASDAPAVFDISEGAGSFTLAEGEARTVTVTFTPEEEAQDGSVVRIEHSAANEPSPFNVEIEGLGVDGAAPAIALSADRLDYEEVNIGTERIETLTIINEGDANLSAKVNISGGDIDAFALVAGAEDFTLAPGEEQEVEVAFTPEDEGTREATLSVDHTADNEPSPLDVRLEGTGVTAPAEILLSDEGLDFGEVLVGEEVDEAFLISNEGTEPLEIEVGIPDNSGDFTITEGGGGFELDGNESLEVTVRFAPTDAGAQSAEVQVFHKADNENSPIPVALEGEGAFPPAPIIVLSDDALDVGTVEVGAETTDEITITNEGTDTLEGEVELADGGSDAFSIAEGGGSFELAPDEAHTVTVAFAPEADGMVTASLLIEHNDATQQSPLEVALEGTGVDAERVLALSDESLAFGLSAVGAEETLSLTLTNEGGSSISGSVELTAATDGAFSLSSASPEDVDLSPGASQTIDVRFTPDAPGRYEGALEISHDADAPDDPAVVELTGRASEAEVPVAVDVDFTDATDASNYRLVGLPGAAGLSLSSTLGGSADSDWRAFRETGADGDDPEAYLEEYDGSDAFDFAPGVGFWLLSREAWAIDQTIDAVELTEEGLTTIALHDGWNIISNPLEVDVDWAATKALAANDGLTEVLHQWDGTWTDASALTSATTGEAFYLFNDGDLEELTLQHPAFADDPPAALQREEETAEVVELIATQARGETSVPLSTLIAGRTSGAAQQHRMPPTHFSDVRVALRDSAADVALRRHLMAATPGADQADTNHADGTKDGHAFSVVIEGGEGEVIELHAGEVAQPEGSRAVLIDPRRDRQYDLTSATAEDPIRVSPTSDAYAVELLIGADAFLDAQSPRPEAVAVEAVYPNPSTDEVTIDIAMPEAMDGRVELFNVLGQPVALLHEGELAAGTNQLRWDGRTAAGTPAAAGVYLLRLTTADGAVETGRITRVR